MTSRRPTFDDIRDEQRGFIGPPAPPQIPKFTPKGEHEAVQAMLLDDLADRLAGWPSRVPLCSQSQGDAKTEPVVPILRSGSPARFP